MADMARMRTVIQCITYFKEKDPETSISEYYLRSLVKQRKIPVFYAGRKQLINLDRLIEYLNSESVTEGEEIKNYGVIRKVGE